MSNKTVLADILSSMTGPEIHQAEVPQLVGCIYLMRLWWQGYRREMILVINAIVRTGYLGNNQGSVDLALDICQAISSRTYAFELRGVQDDAPKSTY